MKDKIILYNSPEAASIKTITGWVDRDGRFGAITNTKQGIAVQLIMFVINTQIKSHSSLTGVVQRARKSINKKDSIVLSVLSGMAKHQ
ncbi:hypothetical protein PROPEN_02427 [Proteus penneri ATCC 35198]|nr:hypothetical protein PROPEN_02427 [Proteus penneri ATCC 35198]